MTPWQLHVETWKDCERCGLCLQRDKIVLARGQVPCDVLLIGEAPGDSENILGKPFVGPAGKLLDDIVDRALTNATPEGEARPRIAYTSLVACYPKEAKDAGTNEPDDSEIQACQERLHEFINLCKPKLIVAVGKLADAWLDKDAGIKIIAIVHPAAIIRMPVAQQGFAAQKCVVTLTNAVEEMLCSQSQRS